MQTIMKNGQELNYPFCTQLNQPHAFYVRAKEATPAKCGKHAYCNYNMIRRFIYYTLTALRTE